jgi:hypothetical protein
MNRILECFKKYQEIVSAAVSGIFIRPTISPQDRERYTSIAPSST